QRLTELELLVGPDREWAARFVPLLLTLSVVLLGVIKIFVGISRHRPVGFLFILCVISAVVAFVALARKVHRSRRGDEALTRLQGKNSAMEFQAGRRAGELSGEDLLLAVGLFGMGILAGGPLAGMQTAFLPPVRANAWANTLGSGWGTSGCGVSS